MRPVAVKEIFAQEERLGITGTVEPPGARGDVVHLVRYAEGEPGLGMPRFPDSLLIIPPRPGGGAYGNGWARAHTPSLFRNISCIALPAQKISPLLRQLSEQIQAPVFSSCYDEILLHCRLTGLLREKGERQVMVHGVLVQVCGIGVLLLGESGIGKTACALALMGGSNRWIADDAVVLEGRGDAVYGRGHPRTAGRIAVRGRGLLDASALLGKGRLLQEIRVDLMVRLVRAPQGDAAKTEGSVREMVGVSLRCAEIAAGPDPRRVAERVTGYAGRIADDNKREMHRQRRGPGVAGAKSRM